MSKTLLRLQDSIFDLDDVTEIEDDSLFKFESNQSGTYEQDLKNLQMQISIELNLNLAVIERYSYSVLDIFSDVGGIQSIFFSAFAWFVSLCNYMHFDTYIASRLFKI